MQNNEKPMKELTVKFLNKKGTCLGSVVSQHLETSVASNRSNQKMASILNTLILFLCFASHQQLLPVFSYTLLSGGGGGVGSSSFRLPTCPMNYMFTCQPQLSPVPCSRNNYATTSYYNNNGNNNNNNPVGAYSEPHPAIDTQSQSQSQLQSQSKSLSQSQSKQSIAGGSGANTSGNVYQGSALQPSTHYYYQHSPLQHMQYEQTTQP